MALDGDEYIIHIRPAVNTAEFRAATDLALDQVEHEFAESGGEAGRRFAAALRRNAAVGIRGLGAMAAAQGQVAGMGGLAGIQAGAVGPANAAIRAAQTQAIVRQQGLGLGGFWPTSTVHPTTWQETAAGLGWDVQEGGFPDEGQVRRTGARTYVPPPRPGMRERLGRGSEVNTGFGKTGRRSPWARHGPGWQFSSGVGPPGGYAQRAGFAGLFGGPWGVAGVAIGASGFAGIQGYRYHSDVEAAERRAFQLFGGEFDDLSAQTEKWTTSLGAAKHELYGVYEQLLQTLLPIKANREEAEKYAFAFGELASQLALFKNADVEIVGRAIQRATVGEFENLKTYGIPVTRNQITGPDGRPLPVGSAEYVRALLPILESYAGPAKLYQPPESQQVVRGLGASWKEFAAAFGKTAAPAVEPLFRGTTSLLNYLAGEDFSVTSAGLDMKEIRNLVFGERFMETEDMHKALQYKMGPSYEGAGVMPDYMARESGLDRATLEQALAQVEETQALHKKYFGHSLVSRGFDRAMGALALGLSDTGMTDQKQALEDAMQELGFPTSPASSEKLLSLQERLIIALEDLTEVEERRNWDEEQTKRLVEWTPRAEAWTEARDVARITGAQKSFDRWQTLADRAETRRYNEWSRQQMFKGFRETGQDYAQQVLMSEFSSRLGDLSSRVNVQRRKANEAVGTLGSHLGYNELARQLKEIGPGAATTFGEDEDVQRGQIVQQMFGLINALPDSMRGAYLADLPKDLKALGIDPSSSIDKYISRAGGAIASEDTLQRQAELTEQAMKNALSWFEDQLSDKQKEANALIRGVADIPPPGISGILGFGATASNNAERDWRIGMAEAVAAGFRLVRDEYYETTFPVVAPGIKYEGDPKINWSGMGN